METEDVIIGVIGLFVGLFLLAVPYGTYRYGRFAERRLLTEAYMKTMEQDYNVGFSAGQKDGYNRGYQDGVGAGKMEILKEEDDGRY